MADAAEVLRQLGSELEGAGGAMRRAEGLWEAAERWGVAARLAAETYSVSFGNDVVRIDFGGPDDLGAAPATAAPAERVEGAAAPYVLEALGDPHLPALERLEGLRTR